MQTEHIENWKELYKCMCRPMAEIAQLNANFFSELAKNTHLNEEMNKPENLLAWQAKLAKEVIKSTGAYAQKATEIWRDAATQTSKVVNDMMHDTVNKGSHGFDVFEGSATKPAENTKSGYKNKE